MQEILAHMQGCKAVKKIVAAGSYRRGKETVGDLDFLVVSDDVAAAMDRLAAFGGVESIIARGDTKTSLRLKAGVQVDLRAVPAESFGAALQYFTGSKEHNIVLRGRAKSRGLKINEYGVFRGERADRRPHGRGGLRHAGSALFSAGAARGPPRVRVGRRRRIAHADRAGRHPRRSAHAQHVDRRPGEHRGDGRRRQEPRPEVHRHHRSLEARDDGRRTEAPTSCGSNGRKSTNSTSGSAASRCSRASRSIFSNAAGSIFPTTCWPRPIGSSPASISASSSRASRSPAACSTPCRIPTSMAIAHPTGRMLLARKPYEIDLDAVMRAARDNGKMLELNAHPRRLDLDDVACAAAKSHGIPVVISTDAHRPEGLDAMRCGVQQARRGGLTKADVLNTRTWPQIKKMLGKPSG